MTAEEKEERFYTQPLDELNKIDAIHVISSNPNWVGIVLPESGGIVAYIHPSNLGNLHEALGCPWDCDHCRED